MSFKVRRAERLDVTYIGAMAAWFHGESGERWPFSLHRVLECARMAVDAGLAFVAVPDDGTVPFGYTMGLLCPAVYVERMDAADCGLYVEPAWRKREPTAGRALLDALEDAVFAAGADRFVVGSESGLRTRALGRMYERAGFQPGHGTWYKERGARGGAGGSASGS